MQTRKYEQKYKQMKNKYGNIVISAMLSVIDIYLAASLEGWMKTAGTAASVLLFVLLAALGTAAACFLLYRFLKQRERRLQACALLWGAPFTLSYVFGCRMRRDGTVFAGLGDLPLLLVQIFGLTPLAAACAAPVLQGFPGLRGIVSRIKDRRERRVPVHKRQRRTWQVWLVSFAIIFLCWIPVFLAYYPSVFAYDAEGQLYQVIAHDYSTHHPLLHTLFLGAFFRLGSVMPGSYSAGMAVHSIVQMALMAGVFGYTIAFLYRKGVPGWLRTALLLFYALFPTNSVLALSTTKDVLFSAFVLLYTLAVYQMAVPQTTEDECGQGEKQGQGEEQGGLRGRKQGWLYVLWTALLLLFRNNAVYAFLLTAPCVCLGLYRMRSAKPGAWKKYLLYSVVSLALFGVVHLSVKAATGAQNGSPREMLSVPLQQMARTRVKEEEEISPEMRRELDKYLPSEWVFAAYDPHLADPVKNRAVIHDDPAGLIKTWLQLGIWHPQTYIDAFLDNSVGYWFLEDRTHAQIYGLGTESGFGYLSTDNRTMPAGFEIIEHSYLPGLRAFMEKIVSDNEYQKVPVFRILFAPACYWWMLCLYLAAAVYRKKYGLILPAVFLVIYYMTLLLSPTALIRYMYPLVVTTPAICCCLHHDSGNFDGKNIQ